MTTKLFDAPELFPEIINTLNNPVQISATTAGRNAFNALPIEEQQIFQKGIMVGVTYYLQSIFGQSPRFTQPPPKPASVVRKTAPLLACAWGLQYTPNDDPYFRLTIIVAMQDEIAALVDQIFGDMIEANDSLTDHYRQN